MFDQIGADRLLRGFFRVLRGDDDRIDAHGRFTLVLHRHLRFSVGTKIAKRAVFAHLRKPLRQLVSQHDGHGHQLFGFAAGVTEHHALIARPHRVVSVRAVFAEFGGSVHAARDILRLSVNFFDNLAPIERESAERVADLFDRLARNFLVIDGGVRRDFARQKQRIVSGAAFHRRTRVSVLFQ